MSEDTRDFIERTQARAKFAHGRELTPKEVTREFAKLDFNQRVDQLDFLDRSSKSDKPLTIEEAARFRVYKSSMTRAHDVLRRNKR
jgi:hypothetical protein